MDKSERLYVDEDRIQRLLQELTTEPVRGVSCEECQERLYEYVDAEADGSADEPEWQAMTVHIGACPACLRLYEDLVAFGELADGVRGVEPPRYPKPDLSFVPSPPGWIKVAIDQGYAWLEQGRARWRGFEIALSSLGGGQQPAPVSVGMMGEGDDEAPQGQRTVAPEGAHFQLQVALYPDDVSAGEGLSRLEVTLTLHDRLGDYSGAQVTLSWGETVCTLETDALGKALFRGLPGEQLETMRLAVALPE